jgi:hypothetical protein
MRIIFGTIAVLSVLAITSVADAQFGGQRGAGRFDQIHGSQGGLFERGRQPAPFGREGRMTTDTSRAHMTRATTNRASRLKPHETHRARPDTARRPRESAPKTVDRDRKRATTIDIAGKRAIVIGKPDGITHDPSRSDGTLGQSHDHESMVIEKDDHFYRRNYYEVILDEHRSWYWWDEPIPDHDAAIPPLTEVPLCSGNSDDCDVGAGGPPPPGIDELDKKRTEKKNIEIAIANLKQLDQTISTTLSNVKVPGKGTIDSPKGPIPAKETTTELKLVLKDIVGILETAVGSDHIRVIEGLHDGISDAVPPQTSKTRFPSILKEGDGAGGQIGYANPHAYTCVSGTLFYNSATHQWESCPEGTFLIDSAVIGAAIDIDNPEDYERKIELSGLLAHEMAHLSLLTQGDAAGAARAQIISAEAHKVVWSFQQLVVAAEEKRFNEKFKKIPSRVKTALKAHKERVQAGVEGRTAAKGWGD